MPTAHSVMLAVLCKRTEQVDVRTPLTAYIKTAYSERDANEAADDLATIQALRNDIAAAGSGAQQGLKDTLVKCALSKPHRKVPMHATLCCLQTLDCYLGWGCLVQVLQVSVSH